MAIFQEDINLSDLVKITENGVDTKNGLDNIRNSLRALYKKCYGNDIDLSSNTADGTYLENIALLLNNMINLISQTMNNFDPNTATGRWLDVLASFNNLERRAMTASKTQLFVYNNSNNTKSPETLTFIDRNNNTWNWTNPKKLNGDFEYSWGAHKYLSLSDVVCSTKGAIVANKSDLLPSECWTDNDPTDDFNTNENGDVYMCVDDDAWLVIQGNNAVVGEAGESDADFRARRILSLGAQSVSVLTGLESALRQINGIKDTFVYNGLKDEENIGDDGVESKKNSIYVVIRKDDNAIIDDAEIGKIIYNKLTPGIITIPAKYTPSGGTEQTAEHGDAKSYTIQKSPSLTYNIYWKECKYESYDITCEVKFTCRENYPIPSTSAHSPETEVEKSIVESIKKYISKISLTENRINSIGILTAVQNEALGSDNIISFVATSAKFESTSNPTTTSDEETLMLSYIDVNDDDINESFEFSYNNNVGTLTFDF